jgi:alkylation response protein AidB-like acyl-CoA dehydrogenase
MIDYRVPLADILFTLEHVAGAARIPGWDSGLVGDVLTHGARFIDEVIAPLDAAADTEGVKLVDGRVRLPKIFHAAFAQFRDAGWQGLSTDSEFGGQGLPGLAASAFSEMLAGACHSFHMATSLGQGAIRTLAVNAPEAMKAQWIPRLAACDWLATMCLTEPQAGSDLSLVRTTATPDKDGWRINGGKIFISGGDQDFTGKVLHLVLARTADAPPGVRGLSLFLAPSHHEDGSANGISVVRIEEKMGLHAAATCQMAFENAKAVMIGAPGEGLKRMFTLMNIQRLDVALQGVSLTECASQRSLAYAASRRQGRHGNSNETAMIVQHDDIRRMLLTQKAYALGGRAMCYTALADLESQGNSSLGDIMTSVCKVFCTEGVVEAANHAIQIHGGYGYLKEYRVEQILRDARITQIYEGTNGIHASTLASRLAKDGRSLPAFDADLERALGIARESGNDATAQALGAAIEDWRRAAASVTASQHPNAIAFHFMRLTGLVAFGAAWARLEAAADKSATPETIRTLAEFVRTFILPETSHLAHMCAQPLRLDNVPPTIFAAG